MNSRNVRGILLSLSLCLAIFAALATVGLTLIKASSIEVHRLETAKFESPKSTLLGDPVPGGGIPMGNNTDRA
jgi:hypothetical protein